MLRSTPILLLCAAALAALAPAQQANRSEARAEARASATNGQSHSATHRVVVENGKTVVDEHTDDSTPAAGPLPAMPSAEDLLRQLQEQMRCGLPVPAKPAAGKPPAGKPPAVRPAAAKPATGKPTGARPAAARPADAPRGRRV
ncbi:MAG: hypothetical protein U1E73_11760 [Planctomycetota bacterium]